MGKNMDEMDGIFTNTTTATEDYFKGSITAAVYCPKCGANMNGGSVNG